MPLQIIVNRIHLSTVDAGLGVGWGITYHLTGTFHFAQALAYLIAGYVGAYAFDTVGLPFLLAFVVAIAVTIPFGVASELGLYRPLRRAGASPFVILIASLGLLIIGENVILLVFGTVPLAMTRFHIIPYAIGPINFANTHVILVVVCAVVLAIYMLFLTRTTTGKAMKATASNPQMAEVVGIDIPKIYLLAFIIASALAGVTGFLHALERAASLGMGMEMVLVAFIATLMGGVGHLWGAAIAGVIMGMAQAFGLLVIGSEWQTAILYLVMVIVIVVRPRGILGTKVTKAEV